MLFVASCRVYDRIEDVCKLLEKRRVELFKAFHLRHIAGHKPQALAGDAVDSVVKYIFDGLSRIWQCRNHAGFLAADMHFVAAADIDVFGFLLGHAVAAH